MASPSYRLLPLQPYVQALQQDATTEVLTLFPAEKRKGLLSYGLPESCEKASDLESWAMSYGMVVKDLGRPEICPQAFRLEKDNTSSLLKGYTAIVVALGNTKYDVELISGDKKSTLKETWDPGFALHLRETGLKATGGHIRFLYIPLHLEPISSL
ncbi:hypothetical protein FALBO_315 [Fusarium albosuccineum]|uniref:Uncharacterized protein n=1 Tax=Fusarium albosuccineum TaxID=1237068 RepID=A0A8H4LQ12_9HYPO|nr:hypothetical protein FALBO_315 [Fusarium albosuccineum]KAF4987504.1 hypothetical protein FDECE_15404 [Fusarium decemcellulare]